MDYQDKINELTARLEKIEDSIVRGEFNKISAGLDLKPIFGFSNDADVSKLHRFFRNILKSLI